MGDHDSGIQTRYLPLQYPLFVPYTPPLHRRLLANSKELSPAKLPQPKTPSIRFFRARAGLVSFSVGRWVEPIPFLSANLPYNFNL